MWDAALAIETLRDWSSLNTPCTSGAEYFLLRASGDSMNEAGIQMVALVLFGNKVRQHDGQLVSRSSMMSYNQELHRSTDAAVLVPRSSNKKHKPIVLRRDFGCRNCGRDTSYIH